MRQQPFLQPREVNNVEFEPLGAVQRHQRYVDVFLIIVRSAYERSLIQDVLQCLPGLRRLRHRVHKLRQIFHPRRVLELVLLFDPRKISGAIERLSEHLGRFEIAHFSLQRFDEVAESS